MRKLMFFALTALMCVSAKAQDASPVTQQGNATIIFYRGSSIFGAAIGCPIRYHGQEIVELGRGRYAEWSVPPGEYILTNRTSSVDVRVGAGESAYVRCQMKTGFMAGRADLQIVDRESFAEHRADLDRREITSPLPSAAN